LKLRGQAPKALRWKRLEQRYKSHKQCVTDLLGILRQHQVNFSCVNRVELDRQHLADVDLLVAVGGDGTVLSSAHFLDHGTIPLLGINSDPNVSQEDRRVKTKKSDERRSHGALCAMTAVNMQDGLNQVLYGGGYLQSRTRIRCKVKSTFSETLLVPALNDLLIANPSPAAVSRFRMGWLRLLPSDHAAAAAAAASIEQQQQQSEAGIISTSDQDAADASSGTKKLYGTVTRFGGKAYDVHNSLNVWSSGMWCCTATGSTAAMAAAGGQNMSLSSVDLQYLIREHMMERLGPDDPTILNNGEHGDVNNGFIKTGEKLHVRWNSQKGRIFIDGSHLTHNLELGDEILIDSKAPALRLFTREGVANNNSTASSNNNNNNNSSSSSSS
jgi:NAD+ kinase